MKEPQIFRSLFRVLKAEEIKLAAESTSRSQPRTIHNYKAAKRRNIFRASLLQLKLQPTGNSHQSLNAGVLKYPNATCDLTTHMWSAKFSTPTTVILPNCKLYLLKMAVSNYALQARDLCCQIPVLTTYERCL